MFGELKVLIKHSSVYGAAQLLRKGIGFIMIPIYTRYLTPSDYGLLELLDLTLTVGAMMLGLRIGSGVIRYYHCFDEQKDREEVFTTALLFMLLLGALVLGVLEAFSLPISKLVSGNSDHSIFFKIIFLCLSIQMIYLVPETYLIVQKKSMIYSSLEIITFISSLSLNIVFVIVMKIGVLGVVLSMLIAKTLNWIVVSAVTLRGVRYSISWKKLREMVTFSLPLVPGGLAMLIIHFSDRFFIRGFCNLSDVGVYSLGYKFGMILSVIVSQPIFRIWDTQRYEVAKLNDGKPVISRIFTYYSGVIIFAGLLVSGLIDEVLYVMATPGYRGASTIVPLIALSYIFYGMGNFLTLGIMITMKTKYIALIHVIIALLNLLFNALFIKRYGITGAGISTVLSFLFYSTLCYVISQKLYPVRFEYGRVAILFGLAMLIFGLSRLIELPFLMSVGIKSLLILGFPLLLLLGSFFHEDEISKGKELLRDINSRWGIGKSLIKATKGIKR